MKPQSNRNESHMSPLARIKKIDSVSRARKYLNLTQAALAKLIDVDPAIISKVENGKQRFSAAQIESIARLVASRFREETYRLGRLWGLKYNYNSPLRFEAWAICKLHRKPVEYQLQRMTDKCPKCNQGK